MDYAKDTEKVLKKLKKLQTIDDTECAHVEADNAVVMFLKAIGYGDVAYEYEQIKKWYN